MQRASSVGFSVTSLTNSNIESKNILCSHLENIILKVRNPEDVNTKLRGSFADYILSSRLNKRNSVAILDWTTKNPKVASSLICSFLCAPGSQLDTTYEGKIPLLMAATMTTFGDSNFCRQIMDHADITQFLVTKTLAEKNSKRELEIELQDIVVLAAISLRSQMKPNSKQMSKDNCPTTTSRIVLVGGGRYQKLQYHADLYTPQVLRLCVKELVDHFRNVNHSILQKNEIEKVVEEVMRKLYPNPNAKCVGCILNAQILSRADTTPTAPPVALYCPQCSTQKKEKKRATKRVEKPMDLSANLKAYTKRKELCTNSKKYPRFFWKDNQPLQEQEDYVMLAASIAVPHMVEELNKKKTNVEFLFQKQGRRLWNALCKVYPNEITQDQYDKEVGGGLSHAMKAEAIPLASPMRKNVYEKNKRQKEIFVAPMTIKFDNLLSSKIKDLLVVFFNLQPFTRVENSYYRAYYSHGNGFEGALEDFLGGMGGPRVRVGTKKSIQSVHCHAVEKALLDLQTEIANYFIRATNEVLMDFVGCNEEEREIVFGQLQQQIPRNNLSDAESDSGSCSDMSCDSVGEDEVDIYDEEDSLGEPMEDAALATLDFDPPNDLDLQNETYLLGGENLFEGIDPVDSNEERGTKRPLSDSLRTPERKRRRSRRISRGASHSHDRPCVSPVGAAGCQSRGRGNTATSTHQHSISKKRQEAQINSQCARTRSCLRTRRRRGTNNWTNIGQVVPMIPKENNAKVRGTAIKKKGGNTETSDYEDVRQKFRRRNVRLLPMQINNYALLKVGKGTKYGRHQDHSHILNSPNDSPIAAPGGGWFPTRMEMVVVTFCLSGKTHGAEADVLWYNCSTGGDRLASITTFGNSCHTQFYGCQDNSIYHESKSTATDDRIVITARFSMLPTQDLNLYLAQDAMDKINPETLQHDYKWTGVAAAELNGSIPQIGTASFLHLSMNDVIDSLPECSDEEVARILDSQRDRAIPEKVSEFWEANKNHRITNWLDAGDADNRSLFAQILLSAVVGEQENCNWMPNFLEQSEKVQEGAIGGPTTTPKAKPNSVAVAANSTIVTPEKVVPPVPKKLDTIVPSIHARLPKSFDNLFHRQHLPPDLVKAICGTRCVGQVKGAQKPVRCVGIPSVSQKNICFHHKVVLDTMKKRKIHRCIVGGVVDKQHTIKTVDGRPPPIGTALTAAEYSGTTTRNSSDWTNPEDPCEVATFQEYKCPDPMYKELLDFGNRLYCFLRGRDPKDRIIGKYNHMPKAGQEPINILENDPGLDKYRVEYNLLKSRVLKFNGTGGATTNSGATAPTASTTRRDDPHNHIGAPQRSKDRLIQALKMAYERDSPVTVLYNRDTVMEIKDKPDVSEHPFSVLGLFRILGYSSSKLNYNQFKWVYNEVDDKYVKRHHPHLSYPLNGGIVFKLQLATSFDDVLLMHEGWAAPDCPYQETYFDGDSKLALSVPVSEIQKWYQERKGTECSASTRKSFSGSLDKVSKTMKDLSKRIEKGENWSSVSLDLLTALDIANHVADQLPDEDSREAMLTKSQLKEMEPTWVTKDEMIEHLLDKCGTETCLQSHLLGEDADGESSGWKGKYSFDVDATATALAMNMTVAACRHDTAVSTMKGSLISSLVKPHDDSSGMALLAKRQNDDYALPPICGPLSPGLPECCIKDAILDCYTSTPSPCANRDLDVATSFSFHIGRCCIDAHSAIEGKFVREKIRPKYMENLSPFPRYKLIKNWETNGELNDLMGDIFFGVTINRLTGNVVTLSRYADWRLHNSLDQPATIRCSPTFGLDQTATNRCSPTFDETGVNDFALFLKQEMGHLPWTNMISNQHKALLPKSIMGTMDNFIRFLKSMVKAVDTRHIFAINLCLARDKRRRAIRDAIAKAITDAGEVLQLGDDNCQKIAHFILADIEGIFPAFAGDVTLESVKMGHGGNCGLDFFKRNSPTSKQSGLNTVGARRLERLQGFYNEMKAHLLQKNNKAKYTRSTLLLVLSEDNKLVNLVSLREFSLIDAEHCLCKLYVTIISCTSSRTIAIRKRNHEIHCHPVPGNPEWIRQHNKAFLHVRNACYNLHNDSFLSVSAVNQLRYLNGRHTHENALPNVSCSDSEDEKSESEVDET